MADWRSRLRRSPVLRRSLHLLPRLRGPSYRVAPLGPVDEEWVAAQRAAYGRDLSPHPLVEPAWPGRDPSPHPLVDLAVLRSRVPKADDHPEGPLAAWLAGVTPETALPTPPGVPPVTYGELRRAALAALSGPPPAADAGVSLVLAGPGALRRTVRCALSAAGVADVEVVVAGRLDPAYRRLLGTIGHLFGGVTLVPAEGSVTELVVAGAVRAVGERLVVVRPAATIGPADAVRLADPLADPAVGLVQPLVLDERGVVVSAGACFGPVTRPAALLAGHAPADAAGVRDLPAALAPVFAVRAADLDLDPALPDVLAETDLSLRLAGRTVLAPTVTAVSRDADLLAGPRYPVAARVLEDRHPTPPASDQAGVPGLDVAGWRHRRLGAPADAGRDDPAYWVPEPLLVRSDLSVAEGHPRLRWTLDTAAPAGPPGEAWGDIHFARSLAAALGRLGQHVAVDPRPARDRWSRDLDDVVLVLRGLDRVQPRPGVLHALWVISHPELVTAAEAAAYPLVYAAGTAWASQRTAEWGQPVRPLLQCTDPALFHPGLAEPDTGPAVLFVGNARGVERRAVRGALAAGADLTLYGAGWRGLVPADRVAGRYVPNAELGALYAAAGVVLNDHWDDMRRDGFLANRLFDAAACGARVVSDGVPGIEAVFGEQVRTFDDDADLARLLGRPALFFPGAERRRELAERVTRDHSFDARAAVLVADVAAALRR